MLFYEDMQLYMYIIMHIGAVLLAFGYCSISNKSTNMVLLHQQQINLMWIADQLINSKPRLPNKVVHKIKLKWDAC